MSKQLDTAITIAAIVLPLGFIAGAAIILIRKKTNLLDGMTGDKRISNAGLKFIEKHEGKRLKAYLCPAGVWTIGIGHTRGVKEGDTITEEQAYELLRQDVRAAENAVNFENLKITQNQFDALVSFTFNMGVGAFKKSTLLKKIKANPKDATIASEFSKWINAGGAKSAGLINRRKEEINLYFS